jgi:hypothetical protein
VEYYFAVCYHKIKLKIESFAEGVFLMGESGVLNKTATDLSPIKSSFLSANGTRYHLHPELIKICGTTEMCCLCVLCLHLVDEEIAIGSINLNLPGNTIDCATIRSFLYKRRYNNVWLI